jgi:putative endonuclease
MTRRVVLGPEVAMTDYGRYVVYLLASRKYGPIYTGFTGNLLGRIALHRDEILPGFTSRYHIHSLVYFEQYDDPSDAILREKRVKKWRREWKIALIEKSNPNWDDLFDSIV